MATLCEPFGLSLSSAINTLMALKKVYYPFHFSEAQFCHLSIYI